MSETNASGISFRELDEVGAREAPDQGPQDAGVALRASEARFRMLADESPVILYATDADGRNVYVNQTYREFFGVSLGEVEGTKWRPLIHPEDMAGYGEAMVTAVREHTPFKAEARVRRADGEWRWVVSLARPRLGEAGEFLGHVGISVDITDRKLAERTVRQTLHRFYSVLDSTYSAIILVRAEGHVEFVNPALCRLLRLSEPPKAYVGLSSSELIERVKDSYLNPDAAIARIKEIIRRGQPVKGEEVALWGGRTCLRDFVPLINDGESWGRLWLHVDITDRKRAEEALREQDRRRAEFLAVLSHELRNPLAPIRNSIYLLEQSAPGTEQAVRAREVIRRQTEHLTRLVDDLLDATRISRGKISLQRSRLDLRDVVRKTTDDMRSVFSQAGVELHVDHVLGPVWIVADLTRITQVLGNILQNAVKFTPAGGAVTVTLAARGEHAELCVRDTGIGMEPGTIEHMFEAFAQADDTLARTKGGLGLGLALVKGLVELHGGTVEARSAGLGHGAEVMVRLPVSEPVADEGHERRPVAGTKGRTILVIEDNLDAGMTLADLLELQGHRVRVARDGTSGIELARELRPEVVLCDIGLPDVDGYEVARVLRRDESLRATRLVALSGYAQPEDRELAREAGFDAHLAKPPDLDELLGVLAGAP